MPDFRSFFQPAEMEPAEITLSAEESHHLARVHRAREGDTVVAFDGRGNEWICECLKPDGKGAVLRVRFHQKVAPLPYRITLAQALPKGKKMDQIVQKATEIGVSTIIPLVSERTQVRLDDERQKQKFKKWETTSLEAAKQCGNSHLPSILPAVEASSFIDRAEGYDLKLIASLQPGAMSLKTVLDKFREDHKRPPNDVLWMIGPEGDFTMAEIRAAENRAFRPVGLGPLVLRCETAAVYALSILSYELQQG